MTETVGWRQALPGDSSAHLIIVIFVIIIIVNSTITVIMAYRHIPTMTNSHHGGFLSVMIMVGICQ